MAWHWCSPTVPSLQSPCQSLVPLPFGVQEVLQGLVFPAEQPGFLPRMHGLCGTGVLCPSWWEKPSSPWGSLARRFMSLPEKPGSWVLGSFCGVLSSGSVSLGSCGQHGEPWQHSQSFFWLIKVAIVYFGEAWKHLNEKHLQYVLIASRCSCGENTASVRREVQVLLCGGPQLSGLVLIP